MMVMPRFALRRPGSLDEAFEAFAAAGGDAAWYAGGTELLQVMKMGFAEYGTLIDLKSIDSLRGIAALPDGRLSLGATSTHREIERSAVVRELAPTLADLAGRLANVRVRSSGTLGGNLAFAEPHSDPATLLLACDGRVELVGPSGTRSLSIDELIIGPLTTAREPDEVITAVVIPGRVSGEGRAYERLAFFERPAASVAVRVVMRHGAIESATVAIGSMTDVPTTIAAAAAALVGAPADVVAIEGRLDLAVAALEDLTIEPDHNGSPDYKRHLAALLLRRAVNSALGDATRNA